MENKRKIPKIPAMAYIASHTGIQGFFIFKPISRHKPEKYRISDNTTHLHSRVLDGQPPACGIPPAADFYEHFLLLP